MNHPSRIGGDFFDDRHGEVSLAGEEWCREG
jgi:hypothetical protein